MGEYLGKKKKQPGGRGANGRSERDGTSGMGVTEGGRGKDLERICPRKNSVGVTKKFDTLCATDWKNEGFSLRTRRITGGGKMGTGGGGK